MAAGRKRKAGGPRHPEVGAGWEESSQAVFLGLRDWRVRHPRATLREIEEELDRRWNALRAQVLRDLALASTAAELGAAERPVCPECGGAVHSAGSRSRTVSTLGNEAVMLTRDYATCPACGSGSFPPGS